jgi:protein arginine kinase activator
MLVCTQCGFTFAEFQSRGLLGCPQCYERFGEALWVEMLQRHPGLFRHASPWADGKNPASESDSPQGGLEELAHLKEMLADALRSERYEEAAGLRSRIQAWETHGPG